MFLSYSLSRQVLRPVALMLAAGLMANLPNSAVANDGTLANPARECQEWRQVALSNKSATPELMRTANRVWEPTGLVRLDYNPARRTLIINKVGKVISARCG